MQLLVIRHAKAEDALNFAQTGQPEAQRPLTDSGRRKMHRACAGLLTQVPFIDVLACSPLLRARQTAEIVAETYGGRTLVELDALAPGADPEQLLEWLRAQRPDAVVAIVGHEPDLGELISWLVSGSDGAFVALKKGAVCLLEFAHAPKAGGAQLHWLLGAGQLADLHA